MTKEQDLTCPYNPGDKYGLVCCQPESESRHSFLLVFEEPVLAWLFPPWNPVLAHTLWLFCPQSALYPTFVHIRMASCLSHLPCMQTQGKASLRALNYRGAGN